MKVATINKFFEKIGRAQIKFRWVILAVFLLITLICSLGLGNFALNPGSEGWYGNADQIKIDQQQYEEVFGNLNGLGILMVKQGDGDLFSEDMLHVIDRLGTRLQEEIPFADRLTSIIEVDIPVGNEEGFEVVKPYQNGIPSDPESLSKARALVMRGTEKTNALINSLVSDDGRECWLFLSLHPFEGSVLDELFEGDKDEAGIGVGNKLMNILESAEFQSDEYKLYGSGMPYDDATTERYDTPEYILRVLVGFVVMLIFLGLFLRTPFGIIVPAITTVGAICTVFGGMSYFGVKADSSLVTVPVILGMALSVGYSVHYINMFKLFFRRTGKRKEAVVSCVEECGWSVLFTVLTTMVSFVSFLFVNMKPVEWMGLTSALVVFAVYVYVSVLIPILLSFGKDRKPDTANEKGATKLDMRFAHWADIVQKKTVLIAAVSALIIITFIPAVLKITVHIDLASISGEKMPYVQELRKILATKIGNEYSYSVMITFDEEGAFKDPKNMASLIELEDFLGKLSLTKQSGGKPRVSSVTSILKEMNSALNEGKAEYYVVPEDEYVLAQLLELSSIEMHEDFNDVMDDDFRITVLSVDMTKFATEEAVENLRSIRAKLAELFPEAHFCLLGDMIQYAEMSSRIIRGGLLSFGFSFIIIAIMLIIAFASMRTGLIGMIPNVTPVIIVGGIMGLCGFALDFGTITIMPMILGIAVDDTIHLTTHLKYGLEKYGSYKTAMEDSFREIGSSMFLTTLILCAMFAVYIFSPLHLLFVVGVLVITGLSSALIADYTITPALLYLIKPFGKEKQIIKENKQ